MLSVKSMFISSTSITRNTSSPLLAERAWPNHDESLDLTEIDTFLNAFHGALEMLDFLDLENIPTDFDEQLRYANIWLIYFNPEDYPYVKAVIKSILDEWRDPSLPMTLRSVFNVHKGHPECDQFPRMSMFWDPQEDPSAPTGSAIMAGDTLYLCPMFFRLIERDFWTCDTVKKYWTYPSGWMETKQSSMVHELLHYHPVTTVPNGGYQIIDHGPDTYGPFGSALYKIHPGAYHGASPRDNAANFEWLVSEYYWTKKCNVRFGPAPENADTVFPAIPESYQPPGGHPSEPPFGPDFPVAQPNP
ncbi:MAG: hypothetical protein Q9227_008887 [Pyrenula ochraceoflavens]